ncbi:hypothetical protein HanXRQr2_Chr17g0797041 [Helianthus annuus]|uniref:Uncharacterized protein n=1 Tax=Helianthus annuus TaxID=4232 RepID=A0A9K3GTB0_HELAN|nr:hypothetical protein HanXRQr2_Chr17g0797041 [Helianthus annuus]
MWKTGLRMAKDDAGIITRGEIKSKLEELLSGETYKVKALDIKEKVFLVTHVYFEQLKQLLDCC